MNPTHFTELKRQADERQGSSLLWAGNPPCPSAYSAVRSAGCRRGISLLEVLISMFVLAVGLLGVAALIPAGRSEIALGSRLENAAMVGRTAFRDLQIRGYLNPTTWARDAAPNPAWDPFIRPAIWDGITPRYHPPFTSDGTNHTSAVLIDPLGVFAETSPNFLPSPLGINVANPHLARIVPNANFTRELADLVFRASHDLVVEENDDLPPLQSWFKDGTTTLRRASEGNYSWFATVAIDPTIQVFNGEPIALRATVSVAVFHKRNLSETGVGEAAVTVDKNGPAGGPGGGEVVLTINPSIKGVRPGDWLMLAGWRFVPNLYYFRWYRVVSAGEKGVDSQRVTLAGADWDPLLITAPSTRTKAFLFRNVVAVYEKNVALEIE